MDSPLQIKSNHFFLNLNQLWSLREQNTDNPLQESLADAKVSGRQQVHDCRPLAEERPAISTIQRNLYGPQNHDVRNCRQVTLPLPTCWSRKESQGSLHESESRVHQYHLLRDNCPCRLPRPAQPDHTTTARYYLTDNAVVVIYWWVILSVNMPLQPHNSRSITVSEWVS